MEKPSETRRHLLLWLLNRNLICNTQAVRSLHEVCFVKVVLDLSKKKKKNWASWNKTHFVTFIKNKQMSRRRTVHPGGQAQTPLPLQVPPFWQGHRSWHFLLHVFSQLGDRDRLSETRRKREDGGRDKQSKKRMEAGGCGDRDRNRRTERQNGHHQDCPLPVCMNPDDRCQSLDSKTFTDGKIQ